MAQPDYNSLFNQIWGWPQEVDSAAFPVISTASNFIFGTNPSYSITDFFTLYPNWGGLPTSVVGTTDGTTANITGLTSVSGLAVGQYLSGPGIASGSTIKSISAGAGPYTLGLSQPTTSAQSGVSFTVYTSPLVPNAITNAYIALATAALFSDRWGELWNVAVGLYVAHFLTLWGQAQTAPPGSTIAQVAAAGLATGIDVGQSAGDVSYSSKPVEIPNFGAWNLTLYGQQLATFAQVIGSGSALLW